MTDKNQKPKGRTPIQDKLKIMKGTANTSVDKGSEENIQKGREFVFGNNTPKGDEKSPSSKLELNDDDVAGFIKEITAPARGKKQGRCKTTIEWQPEDYEKLSKACQKTNLSMSEFVRKCVKRVLDRM